MMRFLQILVALSGVAIAIEPPPQGNPYVAQFQGFVADSFGSFLPSPNKHDSEAAEEARVGDMRMHTLTLENWRHTLYEPVKEGATVPEEWWMLVTGRNKTCWGRCAKLETAWNESAAILSKRDNPPHLAMLNCEDQPILCNAWSAGTGILWVFDMLPPPANITIHIRRLNLTTTTSEDIIEIYDHGKENIKVHEGSFHPFQGWTHTYGLAMPWAYAVWALNAVPNWAFMVFLSFVSRSFMKRSMGPSPSARAGGAPPAGGAGS